MSNNTYTHIEQYTVETSDEQQYITGDSNGNIYTLISSESGGTNTTKSPTTKS